ncbi:MAG: carboxylating nicotinate-nucleotide diphosphorylase [Planctomycetota bacterium]|nr:carboxylating nicotinate-nucleotide diphosphorylase [Planctomycetota bacterium]
MTTDSERTTRLAQAPTVAEYDAVLLAELGADLGAGDITSKISVPEEAWAKARLVARAPGRLAGLEGLVRAFQLAAEQQGCAAVGVELEVADGAEVTPDQTLATITGNARALLWAERTALNLLQHLCGIATLTATFVAAAQSAGGSARVLDTRKTIPGLRPLQKYAVRCGGGTNHRLGLFDELLLKDNHLDLARRPLGELLARARGELGQGVRLVAEARSAEEALAAAAGGAHVVLLDNMTPAEMERLVPALRRANTAGPGCAGSAFPFEVEASGGIDLDTIAAVAACGVDRISVGALTHSAPALDLSLYLEPMDVGATGDAREAEQAGEERGS